MRNTILIALFAVLLISCQEKEKKSQKISDQDQPTSAVQSPQTPQLSALPAEVFNRVYAEAEYLDVIFEKLPFSMSQDNNANIKQILTHLDNKPPTSVSTDCPLFGQQLYMKGGEIILEADFYHSPGCYYYLIRHNGKTYYNGMTEKGIQFFENLKNRSF